MLPVHLVGWAQPPYYDAAHHTLVWARDIRFGSQTDDTLNYDLRALGRRGVLSMNIIATMSELGGVRSAASGLQNIASFDVGSRYTDYKEGEDKKADDGKGYAPALVPYFTAHGFVVAGVSTRSSYQARFPGQVQDVHAAIKRTVGK